MVKVRVLILEDDPSTVALYDAILRRVETPCVWRQVNRLSDALALLDDDSTTYDVALLDMNVLDSRGPETYRRWREHAPNMAVVLLSGMAVDEESGVRGDTVILDKGSVTVATLNDAMHRAMAAAPTRGAGA